MSTSTRSPAAPSRSLSVSFGIAQKIYDDYGHTEFGAPEIAGAGSVSATSGAGKSLVSDLKQYGLIDRKSAGRYAISQDLKNLAALTLGTPEFKAAAYSLVKSPKIFQSILSDAKGKLPEASALANNLRSTYQFNKENASATAKAISDSLQWAGVLDAKRNIIEPRAGKPGIPEGKTVDLNDEEEQETPAMKEKLLTLDIPLTDGRLAHVRYPHDLTEVEAKKIGAVLAVICG